MLVSRRPAGGASVTVTSRRRARFEIGSERVGIDGRQVTPPCEHRRRVEAVAVHRVTVAGDDESFTGEDPIDDISFMRD